MQVKTKCNVGIAIAIIVAIFTVFTMAVPPSYAKASKPAAPKNVKIEIKSISKPDKKGYRTAKLKYSWDKVKTAKEYYVHAVDAGGGSGWYVTGTSTNDTVSIKKNDRTIEIIVQGIAKDGKWGKQTHKTKTIPWKTK